MSYQIGDVVFSDWIIKKQIGKGRSGIVYQISKKDGSADHTQILKVIQIPQNDSDTGLHAAKGMSPRDISAYFQNQVDQLENNIRIMASLRDYPYLVRCEDYQVTKRPSQGKWCILIRMEKLTSLQEYLYTHMLSEGEVLHLADNMARTLELFEQNVNLLHPDITPKTIFLDQYGGFKLDALGTTSAFEEAAGSLLQKGVQEYIAPEVYLGANYDGLVDIYSLGLVLYQALNRNRLPFLPLSGSCSIIDREQAFKKRIEGKALMNPPIDASPEFGRIILKMCAFSPEQRYQSAAALLEELNHVMSSDKRTKPGRERISQETTDDNALTVALFSSRRSASNATKSLHKSYNMDEDVSSQFASDSDPDTSHDIPHSSEETAQERQDEEKSPHAYQTPVKRVYHKKVEPVSLPEKGKHYKSWKRTWLKIITIIIVILGIFIPFYIGLEYPLEIEGGSGSGKYKSGSIVSISAKDKTGAHFSKWETKGILLSEEETVSPSVSIKMPRSKVSMTAVYENNKYRLTVQNAKGSGKYVYGDTVLLKADNLDTFENWSVDNRYLDFEDDELLQPKLEFTMPAEDVFITAHYRELPTEEQTDDPVEKMGEYPKEMIAIARLNIRQTPSLNAAIIGHVEENASVTVLEDAGEGWVHIHYGEERVDGYVRFGYLK